MAGKGTATPRYTKATRGPRRYTCAGHRKFAYVDAVRLVTGLDGCVLVGMACHLFGEVHVLWRLVEHSAFVRRREPAKVCSRHQTQRKVNWEPVGTRLALHICGFFNPHAGVFNDSGQPRTFFM